MLQIKHHKKCVMQYLILFKQKLQSEEPVCLFIVDDSSTILYLQSLVSSSFTSFFFLICIVGGGVQTGSTRHVGHLQAYCT
jgi:hypothetical protein